MECIYDAKSNCFWGNTQKNKKLEQVMWHITNLCNLNCKICFTKKMRPLNYMVDKEKIPSSIKLLKELGVKKIDLSGGEPLLYKHLPYLITSCISNGLYVTITTSGYGSKENIRWICNHWDCFSRIIESLDGMPTLHNELRNSKISYSKFETFHNALKDAGCDRIRINTVVTKKLFNQENESFELCNHIKKLSPNEWCLIQPYPLNKADDFIFNSLSDIEFADFVNKKRQFFLNNCLIVDYRTNRDFASYWALFGNDLLCHSSSMINYDTKFLLNNENLETIRQHVQKNNQTYIKIRRNE